MTNEEVIAELKRYKELLDDGIISQEEFDRKKEELLNGNTAKTEANAAPSDAESNGSFEGVIEKTVQTGSGVFDILKKVFATLKQKPVFLWGLSLLSGLAAALAGIFCGPLPILAIAAGYLLTASMEMIYLKGYRGNGFKTEDVFSAFKDFKTIKHVAGGMGWRDLWLIIWIIVPVIFILFAFAGSIAALFTSFLGAIGSGFDGVAGDMAPVVDNDGFIGGGVSLIFIVLLLSVVAVGGMVVYIVKTYEYRFVPYILMSEPEISAMQALKESKKRTKGLKGKMFRTELVVMIGAWLISVIVGLLSRIPVIGWLISLVWTVVYVACMPLVMGLIRAAFYEEAVKTK